MASIWRENTLGYLSADIICSEKRTVFRECSLRKTVRSEEQIMSKGKPKIRLTHACTDSKFLFDSSNFLTCLPNIFKAYGIGFVA